MKNIVNDILDILVEETGFTVKEKKTIEKIKFPEYQKSRKFKARKAGTKRIAIA